MSEEINPQHYRNGEVECIDAISAATVQKSGIEAVCVSHVIRYLWRYEAKGGLTDVMKASWYCDKLINVLQGQPVYAPLEVSKPQSGEISETLRWVGIDLGSDLLKMAADEIEVARLLLLESLAAVPQPLANRISEHLGRSHEHKA